MPGAEMPSAGACGGGWLLSVAYRSQDPPVDNTSKPVPDGWMMGFPNLHSSPPPFPRRPKIQLRH